MKVSIAGTGYVGLVTGVCLADKGHQVTCIDIDQRKVDKINQGIPPIYEDGLQELLARNIGVNLRATTDLHQAVQDSELSMIAVGTPFDGKEIDLKYIVTVANQLGEALKDKEGYHVIVVKSTVVPGTTQDVVQPIVERASGKRAGVGFGIGMNPEFLREGNAIADFMHPDRIVLGGIDDRTLDVMQALYAPFEGVDQICTTPKTAEMIKYTANSLLATMISFSNEIANLCTALGGIDVVDVMKGVHLDKRLTPIMPDGSRLVPAFTTYLEAGCGFGGSCFPKDVKALIAHGERAGSPMPILDAVIQTNERQPHQVIELLHRHFPSLRGVQTTVLGLAFKPGTDDMRESPAIPVINELLASEAKVKAYDPIATHEAEKLFGTDQVEYCTTLDQAIEDTEAIVLLTRWPEFESLPRLLSNGHSKQGGEHAGNGHSTPLVVDGRRMLDKRSVAHYEGIGLSNVG
jgi:UDPglucose 6-dehydrogenase/GDP-mannose 6-dehydrogenase